MLKEFMERNYDRFIVSFGKHKGEPLPLVETNYALWWIGKRETDETFGNDDLDIQHKMAAERKHNFNRNYLFFAYHIYKSNGQRLPGYGVYATTMAKFWEAIDNNTEFKQIATNDELEAFLYSLWEEEDIFF